MKTLKLFLFSFILFIAIGCGKENVPPAPPSSDPTPRMTAVEVHQGLVELMRAHFGEFTDPTYGESPRWDENLDIDLNGSIGLTDIYAMVNIFDIRDSSAYLFETYILPNVLAAVESRIGEPEFVSQLDANLNGEIDDEDVELIEDLLQTAYDNQ